MKTIEQQIAVMQHFLSGGAIEKINLKGKCRDWFEPTDKNIIFDWQSFDYRIKEKKQTVTIEKWLCMDKRDIDTNRFFSPEGTKEYFEKYITGYEKIKLIDSYQIDISSTEK